MDRLSPTGHVPDILAPYLEVERTPRDGQCWVLANMVGGLDGTAAFSGRVGPLSQGDDVELFELMRTVADVVLVGAETVRREGYAGIQLPPRQQEQRVAAGKPANPGVAIVSRSLELDLQGTAFTRVDPGVPTMVITCSAAPRERLEEVRAVAPVLVAGTESVDLGAALGALADQGHRIVLNEGGPRLLGMLAADDLLDELCLTLSPIMGGDPLPVAITPPDGSPSHYRLAHVLADGSTLFLRYERDRG